MDLLNVSESALNRGLQLTHTQVNLESKHTPLIIIETMNKFSIGISPFQLPLKLVG